MPPRKTQASPEQDKRPSNSSSAPSRKKSPTEIYEGGSLDRSAIELRAWEIWQNEGCPPGRAMEHWLQAEQELQES